MLYLCVDSLFVSESILFYQRAELKTSSTAVASLRMYTCSPLKFTRKYPSLLADTETSMRMFFSILSKFFTKKASEKWCFLKTMTIPCKGWQQNCSASRVGTTVFHLKRGSHVAVKISERTQRGFSERWTATRKMRIPNVTVGGAGMQQVFFFFRRMCWFYMVLSLFWLGTGTTTKSSLKLNVTYLEQLEKDT